MSIKILFQPKLKFKCLKECASKCCGSRVELFDFEIERIKNLGFDNFFEEKKGKYYLKQPCIFLKNNLCILHKEYGFEYKPEICKRYPFYFYKDDNIIVDISWACPGVGVENRESKTAEEELKGLLPFLNLSYNVPKVKKAKIKLQKYGKSDIYEEIFKRIPNFPLIFIYYEIKRMGENPLDLPFSSEYNIISYYESQTKERGKYIFKFSDNFTELWVKGVMALIHMISGMHAISMNRKSIIEKDVRKAIMILDFLFKNVKGFAESTSGLIMELGKNKNGPAEFKLYMQLSRIK